MSGPIERIQSRVERGQARPGVYRIDSDAADEMFDALGAETTRDLFAALFERPRTPSELAEFADTTVQNVNYHLSKLSEAELVEAVDSQYSEKGYEMTLYAPTRDPVVLVGDERRRESVEQTVLRYLAGGTLLVLGSLAVQTGASILHGTRLGGSVVEPAGVGGPVPSPFTGLLEPGAVFFLGCLLVLGVAAAIRRA